MVNIIDVVVIVVALLAALGAFLLFLPVLQGQPQQRDSQAIRRLRLNAEAAQERIAQILGTVEHGASDAEHLGRQIRAGLTDIRQEMETARQRSSETEETIGRVRHAEEELRAISSQLGERIDYVQTYWDQQLGSTVETVRKVHDRLSSGLTRVDEGLVRLHEQEKIAQDLTQKLVGHQKEQFTAQQENAKLATEINGQLQGLMAESTRSLKALEERQQRSDQLFERFSTEIQELEQRAHEHFSGAFQTVDAARQELTAGLEESRQQMEILREHGAQADSMSGQVAQKYELVRDLPVERLTKVVDITDEMCSDLQTGLENARHLLATLEEKTRQVVEEAEAAKKARYLPECGGGAGKGQE